MKIANIISQVDLNGVLSHVVDMSKFLNEFGVKTDIFIFDYGISANTKELINKELSESKSIIFIDEEVEDTFKFINENYTHAILNDTLNIKITRNDAFIHNRYLKCWENLNIIKVFYEHNGAIPYFNNLSYWVNYINHSDYVFSYSNKDNIYKTLSNEYLCKDRWSKIYPFIDFNKYEKYKNNQNREDKLMFIGRYTSARDIVRIYDMAECLKENNILAEVRGVKREVGCYHGILRHPQCYDMCEVKEPKNINGYVKTYGRHERNKTFEYFSNSKFACNFFGCKQGKRANQIEQYNSINGRLETTMMEMVACGCIPLWDKSFGEMGELPNGTKFIDVPYLAVWSDKKDPNECVKELKKIIEDNKLYEKYKNESYRIISENFSPKSVIERFVNILKSITKKEKVYDDYELIKLLSNEETANKFKEHYENNIPVVVNQTFVDKKDLFIFKLEGKKNKKVKL